MELRLDMCQKLLPYIYKTVTLETVSHGSLVGNPVQTDIMRSVLTMLLPNGRWISRWTISFPFPASGWRPCVLTTLLLHSRLRLHPLPPPRHRWQKKPWQRRNL